MENPEQESNGREPRGDKVAIVTEVKERLEQSSAVVVTEYRGLTVKHLADLRRSLRPVGGSYKVYKNTLVRLAAGDAGVEISDHLTGPTALAFTETTPDGEPGDVVTVAKILRDFSKANPDLVIKGGLFEGEPIDADGINTLADVEPREVLLAKLAGLIAAPMQQFAGLLQAVPRDFAYGLQALIEKGGSDNAPASEPAEAAPEAAAEEAEAAPEAAAEEAEAAPEAAAEEAEADAAVDEGTENTENTESPAQGADDAPTETETSESAADEDPVAEESADEEES